MVPVQPVVKSFIVTLLFLLFAVIGQAQEAPTTPSTYTAWTDINPAWDGTYRRIRVPILMYHYISDPPADADAFRIDLSLSPALFRQHMEYLFFQGYTTISLYDLHTALMTGAALPPKPVVLTFDDGYIDHYTTAYPALREFGFTGTFFVITGRSDSQNAAYVSWPQVSEMSLGGMSVENHSRDHVQLDGRDFEFLVYQLLGAQESLQAYTGHTPHMVAYPSGRYDDTTRALLGTMPVWRAVTTAPGTLHTTDNAFELPRLRIHNTTTVEELAELLQTAM